MTGNENSISRSWPEKVIRMLSNGLTLLAGIALLLMMGQMVLDVFLTYFFRKPIQGNLEVVSIYHMVAVVFLPLAMVELRHEHIHVDLVVRWLPQVVQRVIYILGSLISATFFAILAYQTWLDALKSYRMDEIVMGAVYVTIWPAKFILPFSFLLIMLTVLLHAWKALIHPDFDPSPASPETEDTSTTQSGV
ncbi:TRAP transporter small permease [Fodinicurvata sediminis]|uniref:TRAP transporter small permease n=1 Tax=Fodinicurvata sediminis TaxID=1121832 RepID=UPI0003B2F9B5|nr:TRAP transporter small permease [Fodinicurvata sediminis]